MPAWDNVQLQGPPQAPSYNAPNIGMQLGALLGNLPQDYLQGIQQQQQIRQLGLINKILGQQTGGGNAATAGTGSTAMPGGDIYGAVLGQESGNNDKVADSSAGAIGPGQILPSTFNQYAQPGEDIRDPATNRTVSKRILDDYLQRYNGDVPRALTAYYSGPGNVAPAGSQAPWLADKQPKGGPSVSQYVRQTMGRMDPQARAGGGQVASADPNFVPQQGAQPAQASAESPQQPGAPTTQVAQAGPQGAPQGGSAASALVPPQWRTDPRGYADALGNRANQLRKEADRIESGAKIQAGPIKIEPKAEGLRKAADDADATRSRVLDALKQEAEPTETQKLMRAQGSQTPAEYEATKASATKQAELDTTSYAKQRDTITTAWNNAREDLVPNLQLARSAELNPNYYSGPGAGLNEKYKQILGVIDPAHAGDADPQAVYRKSMAHLLLAQVAQLKAATSQLGGSGRIFATEMEKMVEGTQNLHNPQEANRILTEIGFRSAQRLHDAFNVANGYQGNDPRELNRRLDSISRPMFSPEELQDMRKIGAPTMSPQQANKLPKGRGILFKGTDGNYYER